MRSNRLIYRRSLLAEILHPTPLSSGIRDWSLDAVYESSVKQNKTAKNNVLYYVNVTF